MKANAPAPTARLSTLPLARKTFILCTGALLAAAGMAAVACPPAQALSTPDQPELSRPVIAGKTAVKVSWKQVDNATGYRVYTIAEDGSLEKVGSTPSKGRTSLVVSGLEPKQSYTFTVRAVKKKGGSTSLSTWDEEGRTIKLAYSWKYKDGYKLCYDSAGKLIKDVDGIIGKRSRYVLKANTQRCVVTAYAYDSAKKKYCIPVKSWLCSPSNYTSSGTWSSGAKHRFWTLFYNSYSQWTMQIHGNILFHTVPYTSYGNKTALSVTEYNKLGTAASHGCVRMPCDGMKWIYDHCPSGTTVTIYRSSVAGPFGKPSLQKLPKWHTWDPTDPTCKSLCTKHGCH